MEREGSGAAARLEHPGIPCFPGLGRGQSVGAVKAALAPHRPRRLASTRCAMFADLEGDLTLRSLLDVREGG